MGEKGWETKVLG